jgi:hypothetical protein
MKKILLYERLISLQTLRTIVINVQEIRLNVWVFCVLENFQLYVGFLFVPVPCVLRSKVTF